MINHLFGNYLVKSGRLTGEQLETVMEAQKKVRVKLGLIAVAEKLMTPKQSDEINRLQAVVDKRFGDIAVEKGYLTDAQVSRLLELQGNAYLTFAQSITDNGFLTYEEVEAALAEYQTENAFTSTDMEALKSGDSDRIVSLFLPGDVDSLQKDLMQGAVRTIIRLIESDIYIEKAFWKSEITVSSYAMQNLKGVRKASLLFTGDGDALLAVAEPFAGESFGEVNLDALDAVGEFSNCVNGLFCTDKSAVCELDMLPPSLKDDTVTIKADKMCVMPIHIGESVIYLITTFDEYISV